MMVILLFLIYPLMFIATRGNLLKLYKPYTHLHCRSNYFSNRTINQWNQLPDEIIRCNALNSFKTEIDNNYFKENT